MLTPEHIRRLEAIHARLQASSDQAWSRSKDRFEELNSALMPLFLAYTLIDDPQRSVNVLRAADDRQLAYMAELASLAMKEVSMRVGAEQLQRQREEAGL